MTDESERWLKGLARQSSVKNRWPHGHEKPGEPSKPPSGIRRSSGSDSQDGCSSERSHRHAKGRTGEISGRVRAGSETAVPAQVETTQSSTRPRTTPHVQQIPQPTPLLLAPILPTETQPSTTWPFIGAKYSTTQPSVRVGYIQPSKQSPVVLKSKSYSCEGHQSSEGASTHPASSTPNIPPHMVRPVQGHLQSTTTTAGAQESLAILSMSEVAPHGKEGEWFMQQVPEPWTESGTDFLAPKKKPEEYRKQSEAARMEVKSLREQLAQSKAEVERGGNMVAQCERRIHELEAEVSDMNAKHETHIKQLRQEFESILAQKDESSRKAVARSRKFGGDPNASAQQQLEASYQNLIRQKEREFHDKERDFQRRQQHYLSLISQLEDSHETAKMREGELRAEMERLKADYQSQLHKLCGSMPDSSLDDDSRCPSNPIVCQPSSTDGESKVVTGGAVNLRQYQRVLSREQIDIDPAELAGLGARERRTVQRKLQQLQNEVSFRDIDIKTLSDQLEEKEKRITALNRAIEVTRKTTEKGLRHQNEDSYLEQLTKLTGQLCALEASDRAQKNELVKLRVKVKEAEVVTGQLDGVVEQMSDLESQNQALKQQVGKLQEQGVGEAQQSGGEITYQSYNREMMAELKRLKPLEAEVQRLQKELTDAEGFHIDAVKLECQVVDLITRVSEKEKEVSDLQSAKSQLEARIVALPPRDVEGEIVRMREQLRAKEKELSRLKSERMDTTRGQKAAEEATRLKVLLDLKEKDNLKLRSQVASLAALAPADKPTPNPRTKDTAATNQPPPLHLPTDVAELQRVLQEKEAKIAHKNQQLQKFEKTASELTKFVSHTRGQSQIVKELRKQLARAEGEQSQLKMEKDNLSVAKDSIQDEIGRLQKSCTGKETALIAIQQENGRLKEQMDQMKRQMDLLKVEKEQFEGRSLQLDSHLRHLKATMHQEQGQTIALQAKFENTNQELARSRVEVTRLTTDVDQLHREKADLELEAHKFRGGAASLRLQVAAQKSEQDQLHHQLEQAEAAVRQSETDLNLSQARVAELEGEIAEMKTAVSDAEHHQIRVYQELSKLITEKDTLLQAAQAEQLQLTQEKDRFIQRLQSDKDQLRQQLSGQIQRQSQRPHESDFWEVPRNEITLNMHKILGTGAWGFVVEGKFRGQQVAVKCLHDMIRQPEVIEIIRKEICIMAQIRHPNLVLLIAAVVDAENDPLIVTELLDISLRKAYENHRLQGSKLSIFRDVASALNYLHLHQRGEIIHRDVSSANVLLEAKPNDQWKAKLSDFGSAKLAMEAKTTGPGAPAYTAPEVRKDMGIRQTGKLDVYSYGVLLCEVTVEQFPMDGSLPGMVQTVRSRWPFMHHLVTSCMQDHPDNRPTMSYVLGEFDKLRPQK